MNWETEFLPYFYRLYAWLGAGLTALSFIWGPLAGASFGLGVLIMGLILFLWHFTVTRTVVARKASWAWESLLVFIRYFLLGGLIYGMISLFAVKWLWFVAGTVNILPSLLITAFLSERSEE